jgi:hypothetical protein
MLAFADMMRKQIVMPAHLMDDNEHAELNPGRNLFNDYSEVAEHLGGELCTALGYVMHLSCITCQARGPQGCTGVAKQLGGESCTALGYVMHLSCITCQARRPQGCTGVAKQLGCGSFTGLCPGTETTPVVVWGLGSA